MTSSLMEFATAVAQASNGRITLVRHEENESPSHQPEAAEFLKIDGKRLGRDLKLYDFMAKIQGWENTLVDVILEVLMPLQDFGLDASYEAGAQVLKEKGRSVFSERRYDEFVGLF